MCECVGAHVQWTNERTTTMTTSKWTRIEQAKTRMHEIVKIRRTFMVACVNAICFFFFVV